MRNLNKKKNYGRIWTLVGWFGEGQSDSQGGVHSALSALKSTWSLSISVSPIYREGKLELCLAKWSSHSQILTTFHISWSGQGSYFAGTHTGLQRGFALVSVYQGQNWCRCCVKSSCLAGEEHSQLWVLGQLLALCWGLLCTSMTLFPNTYNYLVLGKQG